MIPLYPSISDTGVRGRPEFELRGPSAVVCALCSSSEARTTVHTH